MKTFTIKSMKVRLALLSCATLTFMLPHSAHAVDTVKAGEMKVTHVGDVELSCAALSEEAAYMRDIIDNKESLKQDAKMQEYGVNAAAGIGSFLVGTVTGGIGFAAAGFLAAEAINEDAEEAEALRDVASQRRSFMMGIFNAKGCYGPIEHVMLRAPEQDEATELANIMPAAGDTHSSPSRYNQ